MICKWQRKVECFSMISVTSSVNKKNVFAKRSHISHVYTGDPPFRHVRSTSYFISVFFSLFTIKCDFLVVLALNRTEYDYKDIQCERRSSPFMFKSAINHIRISRCRQHLPTYISMYKRSVHYKWCKWKPWWWWLTFRSLSFRQMGKIEWREFLQNWKYVAHIWLFTQTDRRNGKIGLGSTTKSVIIYAMHSYTEPAIYVTTEHTQSVLELCKIRFREFYKKNSIVVKTNQSDFIWK